MARGKYAQRLESQCPLSYPEKGRTYGIHQLQSKHWLDIISAASDLASPPSTRFTHYSKSWIWPTKNKSTHLFVYYNSAVCSIGIPAKLITLCRMTLSNSCSSVKVGMDLSEYFDTEISYKATLPRDPLQHCHAECSAKPGSASQWHYFS